MNSDKGSQEIEDYGGSDSRGNQDNQDNPGNQGNSGGDGGDGGQFGEFGNTGVGTDLTVEMENTDARTGMVKGDEAGADDAAGPGQYGGETGSISK